MIKIGIFGKNNVKKKEWVVVFRTRHMEVKTLRLMAKDETEILSKFYKILPSWTEYVGCSEV